MGTCSCAGDSNNMQMNTLVKIQSAGRTFIAKKKLKHMREEKLKMIFSNLLFLYTAYNLY